jgi:hypothetical protein
MRPTPGTLPRLAYLASLLIAQAPVSAVPGFFDDLPGRGYVLDDVSWLVNRAGEGVSRERVATIRFLRLVLDPGTRDRAQDLWPEREMLLVEHASGERVAFERIARPPAPRNPDDPLPLGRVGLESNAVEVFSRGGPASPGRPAACSGDFRVFSAGGRELAVAPEDLAAPTVREGVERFLGARLSDRERELVEKTVQIALRAGQSKSLPLESLEVLSLLFPGRRFDPWPEALVFEASTLQALDPAAGSWRSVTEAPEMLPGSPLY